MKRTALPLIANCDDCGKCCYDQEALPVGWYLGYSPMGDATKLPPELRKELEDMLAFFTAHGWPRGAPCVWFDAEKKQCKHYDHRPELCRTEIVPGDECCRRIRHRAGMDGAKKYRLVGGKIREALS